MAGVGLRRAVDGGVTQIEWWGSGYHTIREALDEGWLEAAPTEREGITVYCDEEGKLKGLPVNLVASALFNQVLNGPVVIVGFEPGNPETLTLTEDQIEYYTNAISRVKRF